MSTLRSPHGAVLHLPRNRPAAGSAPPVVALLLHGGNGNPDSRPVPWWWPPVLRVAAFGPALRRTPSRALVCRLRFRARGWNADGRDPVADARWALAQLRHRWPDSPIVPVGHSLGGRVGVAVVADPDVIGMVGLAPWLPDGEPVPDLTARQVVLLHGDADRDIPSAWTREWVRRAGGAAPGRLSFAEIAGGGHAMLRHWRRWHRLAADGLDRIAAGRAGD